MPANMVVGAAVAILAICVIALATTRGLRALRTFVRSLWPH
jgi:hypothetical protein